MKDGKTYQEKRRQDQQALLGQSMKKGSLAFLGITLLITCALYVQKSVLGSSFDIKYMYWVSLLLLSLWAILMIFLRIGYGKYLSTNLHNYHAVPNLFWGGYLLSIMLFLSILPFVMRKEYYCLVVITVTVLVVSIYLWLRAANLTKINFEYLYYLINGRAFFDHLYYGKKLSGKMPKIYVQFVFAIFGLAVSGAIMYQASYAVSTAAIGLSLASLSMFFVAYPMFIYALYFFVIVHPRVAKAFKQPVLSDPMNVFKVAVESLGVKLDNDIFGEHPIKRVIKYEEVFHQ